MEMEIYEVIPVTFDGPSHVVIAETEGDAKIMMVTNGHQSIHIRSVTLRLRRSIQTRFQRQRLSFKHTAVG